MSQYFFSKSDGTRRQLFPGVEAHLVWGDRLMLAVVDLQPHSVVAEHDHPHEQMGIVIEGRAEFTIGGETRVLGPGDTYLMPGGVRHKVVALDAPVRAIDVFNPPREEYK
jgi:quercetin dioxygenase-like cupin family protein